MAFQEPGSKLENSVDLINAIEKVKVSVADAMFEDLYRNPFWDARYGERGRKSARQDNQHHFKFLLTAIQLNFSDTFKDYWTWLQHLLVCRGACTRHVWDFIDSMDRQLKEFLPEGWPQLEPYFEAAYSGLEYSHPGCKELSIHQGPIAERVAAGMIKDEALSTHNQAAFERCIKDNLYHLSYLQDAISSEQPEIFINYVIWVRSFLATFGVKSDNLVQDLEYLKNEIYLALPPELAQPFVNLLGRAAEKLID